MRFDFAEETEYPPIPQNRKRQLFIPSGKTNQTENRLPALKDIVVSEIVLADEIQKGIDVLTHVVDERRPGRQRPVPRMSAQLCTHLLQILVWFPISDRLQGHQLVCLHELSEVRYPVVGNSSSAAF